MRCRRSLQGPGTDQASIQQIRGAIQAGTELTVRILNYTRSGRPFWNMFTLAPMRDSDGTTRFFVGVQVRRSWSIGKMGGGILQGARAGTALQRRQAAQAFLSFKGVGWAQPTSMTERPALACCRSSVVFLHGLRA